MDPERDLDPVGVLEPTGEREPAGLEAPEAAFVKTAAAVALPGAPALEARSVPLRPNVMAFAMEKRERAPNVLTLLWKEIRRRDTRRDRVDRRDRL